MHTLSNHRFPRIKICGVTRITELQFIASAGVDTVGINLVPSSRRYVDHEIARELAQAARRLGLSATAVLRNPSAEMLHEVQRQDYWDFIQLHGDETPEMVSRTFPISVIKAVSWTGRKEESALVESWTGWDRELRLDESAATTEAPQHRLACLLIDAYAPVDGGGTGETADWSRLLPRPALLKDWPLLLAGGLNPNNVALAIRSTRCDGVDCASGVELNPGRKSEDLVTEFVRQSQAGFQETC